MTERRGVDRALIQRLLGKPATEDHILEAVEELLERGLCVPQHRLTMALATERIEYREHRSELCEVPI